MNEAELIAIDDRSRIAQCRRRAKLMAGRLGYSEVAREHVGIVASEAVSNVLRHAGTGYCLLHERYWDKVPSIELIVWDNGPGIVDVSQCLQDGYSTAGGPGTGLGAIKRLSEGFELYNPSSGGLVITSRIADPSKKTEESRRSPALGEFFGVSIPKPSEAACGDAWAMRREGDSLKLLVVDGLGHGPQASESSSMAVETFRNYGEEAGESLLPRIHEALRGKRGAVAAIAEVDAARGSLRYTGVGNIFGKLVRTNGATQLISHNGTLGQQLRRVQGFEHEWSQGNALLMHSDGLSHRWALDAFPGLIFRSPSLICGTLMSQQCRMMDDFTLLCLKFGE